MRYSASLADLDLWKLVRPNEGSILEGREGWVAGGGWWGRILQQLLSKPPITAPKLPSAKSCSVKSRPDNEPLQLIQNQQASGVDALSIGRFMGGTRKRWVINYQGISGYLSVSQGHVIPQPHGRFCISSTASAGSLGLRDSGDLGLCVSFYLSAPVSPAISYT